MKTLFLVRHAKSDWHDPSLQDFDRPLNERGKRDAPAMALRLLDRKETIDLFVSSPAKRARKTAAAFAEVYGQVKEDILLEPRLYLAPPSIFFSVLAGIDDSHERIALFAHNPGITDLANLLTEARIDELPTCGIFAVTAATNRWAEFEKARKQFLFCDYPKKKE